MANKESENNYREQRKQRLAKAAKKKSKKVDSVKVVTTVLIVALVAVLLAGICGGLYAYGVPQKLLPALKVGDRTYSVAEYSFYYTSVYQTYANQSYSTQQSYGITLGFDYQKDPAEQTTKDEEGNEITYDQFFRNYVEETLESYNYYLKLAKDEGMTLTDESKKEIEDAITELTNYAAQNNYSPDRYVSVLYGKGLNLKKYRSLMEEQALVTQYVEKITNEMKDGITMDEINAAFAEDPAAYQQVDLRLFGLDVTKNESSESETAAEGQSEETTAAAAEENAPSEQEKLAREMMEKVTDEQSFIQLAKEYCAESDKETFAKDDATLAIGITKETVQKNIDEDLAEWLFAADRAVGDKTVCVTDSYVYVIMIKNTAYRNETPLVNARHILVSFDSVAADLAEKENEEETAESTDETAAEPEETTAAPEETTAAAQESASDVLTASDGKQITAVDNYSAEVVLAAYEKALEIMTEYNLGAKTEESFAQLAEDNSDDTGSIGENGQGGLYENITKGTMVKEFENWVYDENRQPGDVEIIQTTYGFHIMYFVNANGEPSWVETIRTSIATEKTEKMEEDVKAEVGDTAKTTSFTNYAGNEALKLINRLYVSTNNA